MEGGKRVEDCLLRGFVLFCCVNPLFSVYFCYDAIGSLGPYLIQSGVLTTVQLSALISIYSIVPLVSVLVTGILVDLTGLRAVFIYSLVLVVSGNTIVALAFKANTFWMMIVGRIIMGSAESVFVVSLALIGLLFKDNITVATSIAITWGQIGAVLVFIIQPAVYSTFGLFNAMMVPIASALFSLSTSLLLLTLDILFLGNTTAKTTQTEKVQLSDLKNFSIEYWLIMLGNALPTGAFIVSQTLSSLYLVEWGMMEEQEAGYVVSVANMIQLVVPLFGLFIQKRRKYGYAVWIIGATGMVVFYCLLALRVPYPAAWIVLVSVSFSMVNGSLISIIPLFVEESKLGTAIGINQLTLNLCFLILPEIVGSIRNSTSGWSGFFLFAGVCAVSLVCLVVLFYRVIWTKN